MGTRKSREVSVLSRVFGGAGTGLTVSSTAASPIPLMFCRKAVIFCGTPKRSSAWSMRCGPRSNIRPTPGAAVVFQAFRMLLLNRSKLRWCSECPIGG